MKTVSRILATTHLDSHSEAITLEGLKSFVASVNAGHVPVGIEHDPRIAPVGRIASARVRPLDDGEFAAVGVVELFEAGDDPQLLEDGREIPLERYPDGGLQVMYDRNLRGVSDQAVVDEIAALFGTAPCRELKKSLDPLTVLTIGGAFVLGGMAQGFLSKLGEDAYQALKGGLKKLFARRRDGEKERLLVFRAFLTGKSGEVEAVVIISNPSGQDIDDFLGPGLAALDASVKALWCPESGVKRFVFEYSAGHLTLRFGVRRDAVPMSPRTGER